MKSNRSGFEFQFHYFVHAFIDSLGSQIFTEHLLCVPGTGNVSMTKI